MKSVLIYKRFERIWHWSQAALIIFLAVTGFEVHGSLHFFGFEKAVSYHRIASWLLLGLIAFAVFWHFTTGEWKHYIPTTRKLKEQMHYYIHGIFHNAHHPTKKSTLQKLNPLQILTYLGFKLVLIPLTIISGLLYLFHKTIDANNLVVVKSTPLNAIALGHTLGAFLLIAFLIVHIYMTTTGNTLTSNLKAMITGYEELDSPTDTNVSLQQKEGMQ